MVGVLMGKGNGMDFYYKRKRNVHRWVGFWERTGTADLGLLSMAPRCWCIPKSLQSVDETWNVAAVGQTSSKHTNGSTDTATFADSDTQIQMLRMQCAFVWRDSEMPFSFYYICLVWCGCSRRRWRWWRRWRPRRDMTYPKAKIIIIFFFFVYDPIYIYTFLLVPSFSFIWFSLLLLWLWASPLFSGLGLPKWSRKIIYVRMPRHSVPQSVPFHPDMPPYPPYAWLHCFKLQRAINE